MISSGPPPTAHLTPSAVAALWKQRAAHRAGLDNYTRGLSHEALTLHAKHYTEEQPMPITARPPRAEAAE